MPSAYLVDAVRRLVLSRCWGVLTSKEVLAMLEGTVRDPNFAVDFSQLADMSEVSRLDVSTDVVHYIAATTPFGEGSKRALVAGSDIVYGMARLYGTVAEQRPGEFRAFREMSSAIEWLGLQDDEHAIRETIASLPPLAISE